MARVKKFGFEKLQEQKNFLRIQVYPGNYTLTIYCYINPYSVTSYTLIVTEAPVSASSASCCGLLVGQSNLDYATINQVKGGNAIISDASNPRNKLTSYQDMMRLKTALAFSR